MSITTDKDDYAPGDTVKLTGAGWIPGDTVDIKLTDDSLRQHDWAVGVDSAGEFHDSTYVVAVGDIGVTFTLTATGRATGQTLTVQFTDAELLTAELTGTVNDVTVTQGSSANFNISLNATGAIKCVATAASPATARVNTVFSISAGGVVSSSTLSAAYNFFAGSAIGGPNCDVTWTGAPTAYSQAASVSAAAATPVGNYTITLSSAAGTVALTNPAGAGGALTDAIATTVTVHVVAAANQAPTADAGGPYTGTEGAAIHLDGSKSNDPDGDAITYHWTVDYAGIDTGGDCKFFDPSNSSDPGTASSALQKPDIKCTDDSKDATGGKFKLTLKVTDTHGADNSKDADLTVNNVAPTADAGGSYSGDEGSAITLSGSSDDAGSNDLKDLTYKWTVNTSGIDGGGVCTFDDDTKKDAKVTCTDDSGAGTFTLSLTVKDDDGGTSTASSANLTVKNVAPPMSISSPVDWWVWAINAPEFGVQGFVTASFSDAGTNDTHTCTIDWGDGDSPVSGTISEVSGAGTCKSAGVNPYTDDGAGIYLITVTVADADGGQLSASRTIVVYDPSAGFVTGGGWINSPAGAYRAYPGLEGRANFGFVSKYQKGANVPTGNTEFQFQAGNLNFHSDTYDWLVVNQNGVNAQFKGNGLINGQGCSADREGKCRFMLWAYDGTKNGGYDTFRIEIWTEESGGTKYDIYDNGGSGGGGFSNTAINGGSIQVQTGKK